MKQSILDWCIYAAGLGLIWLMLDTHASATEVLPCPIKAKPRPHAMVPKLAPLPNWEVCQSDHDVYVPVPVESLEPITVGVYTRYIIVPAVSPCETPTHWWNDMWTAGSIPTMIQSMPFARSAPEIDPNSADTAVTVLAIGLILLRRRK